jgi:hypothetical protein
LLSDQSNKAPPVIHVLQTVRSILFALLGFFVRRQPSKGATTQNLAESVMQHPMVAGLAVGGQKCPQYLPSGAFSNAVVGILLDSASAAATSDNERLTTGVSALEDPYAKKLLRSLLADAKSLDEARQRLEKWFNDSMDRVSGAYKRRVQSWLYVWATVVVVFLNLDTIEISRRLLTDAQFRTVLVNSADRFLSDTNNVSVSAPTGQGSNTNSTPIGPGSTNGQLTAAQLLDQINRVKLPIGWGQCTNDSTFPGWIVSHLLVQPPDRDTNSAPSMFVSSVLSGAAPCPKTREDWYLKLLGLLITIGAISQGAPFWFDILNKVTNLRASGHPPKVGKKNVP